MQLNLFRKESRTLYVGIYSNYKLHFFVLGFAPWENRLDMLLKRWKRSSSLTIGTIFFRNRNIRGINSSILCHRISIIFLYIFCYKICKFLSEFDDVRIFWKLLIRLNNISKVWNYLLISFQIFRYNVENKYHKEDLSKEIFFSRKIFSNRFMRHRIVGW